MLRGISLIFREDRTSIRTVIAIVAAQFANTLMPVRPMSMI